MIVHQVCPLSVIDGDVSHSFLAVLGNAAAVGILYRDVNPSNILCLENGRGCLIDLDYAKFVEAFKPFFGIPAIECLDDMLAGFKIVLTQTGGLKDISDDVLHLLLRRFAADPYPTRPAQKWVQWATARFQHSPSTYITKSSRSDENEVRTPIETFKTFTDSVCTVVSSRSR